VHWHGVDVPFEQDGIPGVTQKAIKPGETFSYEFTALPSGTRLYHTHGSDPGTEARQIDMGLAGPLIIEPKKQAAVDVDHTLVLDEWAVEPDGLNVAMMRGAGHAAHTAGFNIFTINGRAMPDFEPIEVKQGQRVRLRLINAGSSAIHPMHLHGHQFTVTALDGNPVPVSARQKRNVITLASGETADIEFVAQNPGAWMLHCHELHHADGGMMTLLKYEGYEPIEEDHGKDAGH
jgi:FtsP/CotA-like multicopper oxidase with cupredoxin domain